MSTDSLVNLGLSFARAGAAFRAEPNPTLLVRRDRLKRLEQALLKRGDDLVAAMQADFGHRSPAEASVFDVTVPIGDVRRNLRHVARWMKPRHLGVPLHLLPARGLVMPQPKGVVGVIAPWNFPVYLSIAPVAAALAAGNRVLLKPSELTPRTAEVMREMVASDFDPAELAVHTGGVDLARAFAELPFSHLLYTGSTRVGREIAMAAARNLTPVTLELGGKSPAVLGTGGDLQRAARRIAFGKCANAGQICVAPDYALVPRERLHEFASAAAEAIASYYPCGVESADFTGIISPRHHARLAELVDEVAEQGARILRPLAGLGTRTGLEPARKFEPTLVLDPDHASRLMQEEIFGPVLPIVPYDTLAQAQAFVAERPAPLALYIFTDDRSERDAWLRQTLSGGVCVNETAFHVLADTLPFGGVGESGMGTYHGEAGFQTFSHMKSVLVQPRLNTAFLFNPPIGHLQEMVGRLLRRIV